MSEKGCVDTGPLDDEAHIKDIHMRTEDKITRRMARVIVEEFDEDEVYSSDIEPDNDKTDDFDTQVPNVIR